MFFHFPFCIMKNKVFNPLPLPCLCVVISGNTVSGLHKGGGRGGGGRRRRGPWIEKNVIEGDGIYSYVQMQNGHFAQKH